MPDTHIFLHNQDVTPNDLDKIIGTRIRDARIKAGLTQTQLGERCNVSFQQIQKYEKATNRVSCSMLILISKAVNVHPNVFFAGLDDALQLDIESDETRRGRESLLRYYAKLNDAPEKTHLLVQFAGLLVNHREYAEHLQRSNE